MINGARHDNKAKLFKSGATSVLKASGVTIGKQYDTPDWSPDKPAGDGAGDHRPRRDRVCRCLRGQRRDRRRGHRGHEGAGIKAEHPADHRSGRRAARHPAHPGRRSVHDGLQADQATGRPAAEIAVDLAKGKTVPTSLVPNKENNGKVSVPTSTHDITAVTKANVKDTVIKDGYWSASQVCAGPYAAACKAAGIQ